MDDMNRSGNRRGTNTSDFIDESAALTELERIGARVGRKSIQRSQLDDRMRSEGKALNSLIDEGRRSPIIREGPVYNEAVGSMRSSIGGLRSRMNTLDAAGVARAESEASTYISRQFNSSAINGQAIGMQRLESVQNRAFSMMNTPYDQLQAGREGILSQIRGSERGALNEVKGLFNKSGQVNPQGSAALGATLGTLNEQIQSTATMSAAQHLQKSYGVDPNSRLNRVMNAGKEASELISAQNIAKEMRSGGVSIAGRDGKISSGNIESEIVNQSKNLAKALENLANGAELTDEKLAGFREAAETATDNIDKLKKAAGGGGGGLGLRDYAMGVASGFNAIGSGIQGVMVDQRMGMLSNVAGHAGIENQKYDMYRGARNGDALSMLSLSGFSGAQNFGTNVQEWMKKAQLAHTVGAAAQGAVGGALMFQGFTGTANPASQLVGNGSANARAMLDGGVMLANAGSTGIQLSADMLRDVGAGNAAINSKNMSMGTTQALFKNSAHQLQNFSDYAKGLGEVSMNMGSAGGSFLADSMSDGNLDRMVDARMSPEQYAAMSAMGVEGQGSMFNKESIYGALDLERASYGSMPGNMTRMSTLASAGSNNPMAGLGSVLEASFTKGLESSKAISAMVSNTAAMVQSSVGRGVGIDTTADAATLLASGINMNDPNKEFALARAATDQGIIQQIGTNTSTNFAGMVATARIGRETGLDGTSSILAQKVDTATIRKLTELAKTDPNKAIAGWRDLGVEATEKNIGSLGQNVLSGRVRTLLEADGKGIANNLDVDTIANKIMKNQALNPDEKFKVQQTGQLANIANLEGNVRGVFAKNDPNSVAKAGDAIKGKPGSVEEHNVDFFRTSGFKQLAESTKQANKQMERFGGAMAFLVGMTESLEKDGANGAEGEFAGAAFKSAESWGNVTHQFSTSVNKFDTTINDMMKKLGFDHSGEDKKAEKNADAIKTQDELVTKKGKRDG